MSTTVLDLDLLTPPEPLPPAPDPALQERAAGALLGALAGDALGEQCEFLSASDIASLPIERVETMHDDGYWRTLPGQPTDDTEMALILARSIIAHGRWDAKHVTAAYIAWMDSHPFDIGTTTRLALRAAAHAPEDTRHLAAAQVTAASQANGGLMRSCPLAIWGVHLNKASLQRIARTDTAITHPHPVCQDATAVYVTAVRSALRGASIDEILAVAERACVTCAPEVRAAFEAAHARTQPAMDEGTMGWVIHAFRNAFWQLRAGHDVRAGILDTIRRGGDTDTTACIAGGLLGAVYGRDAIPAAWRDAVLDCYPTRESPRPRPRTFWPIDADEVVRRLLENAPTQ
jgi:ADP-ribosyl-[dinitrogen reductase] hydrolase